MEQRIPLYNADGELRGFISGQQLARLETLGRIARVVRHRKGHINRAIQVRLPGEGKAIRPADYCGTRYSLRQQLGPGLSCWRLRALGDKPSETNLAPEELRPVFMRVVTDCLARA